MFERLDSRSPTPLYAQIAARIRLGIAAGELAGGHSLPSVRQLAAQLRINPATVVQAYRELERDGLVATRQGAGTHVLSLSADRRAQEREAEARRLVRELLIDARRLGISVEELQRAINQELNGGSA